MGFVLIFGLIQNLFSNTIPSNTVILINGLSSYLKKEVKEQLAEGKSISEAALAHYLHEKFSEHYFF